MATLEGKVALITGGGTGIGRACALRFARAGADIAICGRRPEPLQATIGDIEALGVRATFAAGDVGDAADVRRVVDSVVSDLGGIDCLVNNASIVGQVAPVVELDLAAWDEALRVNLTGPMLCCQVVIPVMLESGGGTIVNVSSDVGRRGFPHRAPYVSSKWGLHGFAQTLALEVAAYGIRVNTICPGPVLTERLSGSMQRMAEARGVSVETLHREWVAESPMGRFATAEECAEAALFLASDASSAMTGQALNVTAGVIMT